MKLLFNKKNTVLHPLGSGVSVQPSADVLKLIINILPDSTQLKISISHHIQHEQTLPCRLRKTCKQKEFLQKREKRFLTSLRLPKKPCLLSLTHAPSVRWSQSVRQSHDHVTNFSRFQRDPKVILSDFSS